ncbi:MAG: hypothetical protein E7174_01660 [Firmicutes bacterium]|nr:hypothetical protein [Bacillota bacterium]
MDDENKLVDKIISWQINYQIKNSKITIDFLEKKLQLYNKKIIILEKEKPLFFQKRKLKIYNNKLKKYNNEIKEILLHMEEEINFIAKLENKN